MSVPPTETTPQNISTVTETVTQTSIVNVYYPGAAACNDCTSCDINTLQVPCNAGDWAYQTVSCCAGQCANQLACSTIDQAACPAFPNVTGVATWKTAPQVNCTYQIDDFTQVEDVSAYAVAFGTDDNYNNQIAPFFCSQSSNSCPLDPNTGMPIGTCSMYWDTGAGGTLCQNWATANPQQATVTFTNYCNTVATPDCTVLSSPFTGGTTQGQSWWQKYGWMVVAIVVAALFLLLLIWFIVVMSRSSGKIERIEEGREQVIVPNRNYTVTRTTHHTTHTTQPVQYVQQQPVQFVQQQPVSIY